MVIIVWLPCVLMVTDFWPELGSPIMKTAVCTGDVMCDFSEPEGMCCWYQVYTLSNASVVIITDPDALCPALLVLPEACVVAPG